MLSSICGISIDLIHLTTLKCCIVSCSNIKIHVHLPRLLILGGLHLETKPVNFLVANTYALLGSHLSLQLFQLEQDVGNDILKVNISIGLGNHNGVLHVISNIERTFFRIKQFRDVDLVVIEDA